MRTLIAAGLLAVAGGVFAPSASADQYSYVNILDDNGVHYSNILGVMELGKAVCHDLRGGVPVPAVINGVASLGYVGHEVGIIILAAAQEMCPDVTPVLQAHANQSEVRR